MSKKQRYKVGDTFTCTLRIVDGPDRYAEEYEVEIAEFNDNDAHSPLTFELYEAQLDHAFCPVYREKRRLEEIESLKKEKEFIENKLKQLEGVVNE